MVGSAAIPHSNRRMIAQFCGGFFGQPKCIEKQESLMKSADRLTSQTQVVGQLT